MNWAKIFGWLYEKAIDALTKPAAPNAVSGHVWLGSGDDEMQTQEARVARLHQLQIEAVYNPEWEKKGDKTFCNKAAQFQAESLGYTFQDAANETIDDMIHEMAGAFGRWTEDSIERGHAHALKGGLALVCFEEYPHGHVAAIAPEPMQKSETWGALVPMVANVGESPNAIKKLSQAFFLRQRPSLRCFLLDVEKFA